MLRAILLLSIYYVFELATGQALARPEYTTKEKITCVSCHVTPWGGGPRTVLGKTYGARGLGASKTIASDLYYGDLRLIAFYPFEDSSSRSNGVAVMQASATGNVPILENEDGSEFRAVGTFNIAPLSSAHLREAFIRYKIPGAAEESPLHLTVGQFFPPFGLLTDEHRTYTRMQSNSTLNQYLVGAVVSGNLGGTFHYDLGLVNDFKSAGSFNSGDLPWGGVLNLTWNPSSLPFLLGVSGNYLRTIREPQPYAGSLYTALSLDRLTSNSISGSLSWEGVAAKNWNNSKVQSSFLNGSLTDFFISSSSTDYRTAVKSTASFGTYLLAKYNLTNRWTVVYKLDYLAFDASKLNENFTRHGFGLETFLNTNLILSARVEFAQSPRDDISAGHSHAVQDDVFAMLRLWL